MIARRIALAVLASLVATVTPAVAEETAPQAPAEQDAVMAAWMAYATPGDAHARLEPMVGTFEAFTQHWMQPGAPPVEAKGRSENRWILGGRYLQQDYKGDFMGMPFEGQGLTAYDNVLKQYVGTWIDNMGTGIATTTGTVDDKGTTFAFTATMTDPMSKGPHAFRQEIRVESPDRHVFDMYEKDPATGQEFLQMRIVYTRVAK